METLETSSDVASTSQPPVPTLRKANGSKKPTKTATSTNSTDPSTKPPGKKRGPKKKPFNEERLLKQKERRVRANERERSRMNNMNDSLHKLREHMPIVSQNNQLSKIETLRMAINYISTLSDLIEKKIPPEDDLTLARRLAKGMSQGTTNLLASHFKVNPRLLLPHVHNHQHQSTAMQHSPSGTQGMNIGQHPLNMSSSPFMMYAAGMMECCASPSWGQNPFMSAFPGSGMMSNENLVAQQNLASIAGSSSYSSSPGDSTTMQSSLPPPPGHQLPNMFTTGSDFPDGAGLYSPPQQPQFAAPPVTTPSSYGFIKQEPTLMRRPLEDMPFFHMPVVSTNPSNTAGFSSPPPLQQGASMVYPFSTTVSSSSVSAPVPEIHRPSSTTSSSHQHHKFSVPCPSPAASTGFDLLSPGAAPSLHYYQQPPYSLIDPSANLQHNPFMSATGLPRHPPQLHSSASAGLIMPF